MPEAKVRGVILNYRIVGERGALIALTPGSRRGYDELVPIAERFAAHGYRVLLHDRRNCGRSEVAIEAGGSEHEIWADDLDALCEHLGENAVYAGGASAGARLALLFALRHPERVKGLLLWRVTGGAHAAEKLAQQYYGDFIALAEKGGMDAVASSEHFAACIKSRPSNRERLIAMAPQTFIAIMNDWRENFLHAATLPVVGATEAQLRGLKIPVCLVAGNDKVHTPLAARKAAALIPDSELHDDVVSKRAENDLLDEWDQAEWKSKEDALVALFTAFLARIGAARAPQPGASAVNAG